MGNLGSKLHKRKKQIERDTDKKSKIHSSKLHCKINPKGNCLNDSSGKCKSLGKNIRCFI